MLYTQKGVVQHYIIWVNWIYWNRDNTKGKNESLNLFVWAFVILYLALLLVFLMFSLSGGRILLSLSCGCCILTNRALQCISRLSVRVGISAAFKASSYSKVGYASLRALSWMCSIALDCSFVSPGCQTGEAYSKTGLILEQNMLTMSFADTFALLSIVRQ